MTVTLALAHQKINMNPIAYSGELQSATSTSKKKLEKTKHTSHEDLNLHIQFGKLHNVSHPVLRSKNLQANTPGPAITT